MKILMLLQKDFPPDIRVEKEAKVLVDQGHRVYLICRHVNGGPKKEVYSGVRIHRVGRILKNRKLGRVLSYPLFLNPLWIIPARRMIKREKIGIIHAHDLPMVPLALLVRSRRTKVIFDMHENYPAAMRIWNGRKAGFGARILKNPSWAASLERIACKLSDRIIVVVPEQKERLKSLRIDPEKVRIVSNRVDIESFKGLRVFPDIVNKYRSKYVLLYIGSFAEDRGLEIPIMAMKKLKDAINNIRLLIVGEGPVKSDLISLAQKYGVSQEVEFISWRPFEEIPSFISAAAICLVPQPKNEANDTTIPHKLFQYIALKKPVIVSDAEPLKRLVLSLHAGEVFQSANVASFSDAVMRIALGRGRYYDVNEAVIAGSISWERDAESLKMLYRDLLNKP